MSIISLYVNVIEQTSYHSIVYFPLNGTTFERKMHFGLGSRIENEGCASENMSNRLCQCQVDCSAMNSC